MSFQMVFFILEIFHTDNNKKEIQENVTWKCYTYRFQDLIHIGGEASTNAGVVVSIMSLLVHK